MEFRVLGPLDVSENGETIPLGGTRQRAVLAVLLLHAGHVVSSDRLVDELWGEEPPPTATHTIQVYVSNLRKALATIVGEQEARARLETRPPGYRLRVDPGELDLTQFEELVESARGHLEQREARLAAGELKQALGLWRGPALADFEFEPFAQSWIARLEELRLTAVEERVEAELASGRHPDLVAELEALVPQHPLRERLRGQLMLALYRSGRQAEALEAYQEARSVLVDELGIDPSPSLQRLEKSILQQDPALDLPERTPSAPLGSPVMAPTRSILVIPDDELGPGPLIRAGGPLARSGSPHELIVVSLLGPAGGGTTALKAASSESNELRAALALRDIAIRATAFTSTDRTADTIRLSLEQRVDLLLVSCPQAVLADGDLAELARVLGEAPCDVALLVDRPGDADGAIAVPFGGSEHDWSALELGAWIASATGAPLRLLGIESDPETGRRDASRLLASAALAVQQLVSVATEPVLVEQGGDAVVRETHGAAAVVVGLSERWRTEGLGPVRLALAQDAHAPVLLVRSGIRPGGLAPADGLTRYTWSLGSPG